MRRTVSISVSEELYSYMLAQSDYGSVSEYIRGLVNRDRQRRADYAARPVPGLRRANESFVVAEALEQLERLRTVLERRDTYDD
jgi:Arc/MetJ-type ribon-helix-helix transcriptional regulator